MAKPRITLQTRGGELQLLMNPEGRDGLVKLLTSLSASNDHVHLMSWDPDEPLSLSTIPYRDTDTTFDVAKLQLRLDEWDKQYFPHVMP